MKSNKQVKAMIECLVNDRCGDTLCFPARFCGDEFFLPVAGAPPMEDPFGTIVILGDKTKLVDWFYEDIK